MSGASCQASCVVVGIGGKTGGGSSYRDLLTSTGRYLGVQVTAKDQRRKSQRLAPSQVKVFEQLGLGSSFPSGDLVISAVAQSSEVLKTLFERQEAMARVQAHLVTIVGCLICLSSFCLLPYLAIADAAFTGF